MTASPTGIQGYYLYDRPVTTLEYRRWDYGYVYTQLPTVSSVVLRSPLFTSHQPLRSGLTWIQRFELTNPNRQQDWPVPQGYPRSNDYTWVEPGNSLLPRKTPFVPPDYPNPIRTSWYQSWTQSFNLTNPTSQHDWPIPTQTTWYRDWSQNLVLSTLSSVQNPFRQSDWPLPQQIQQPIQTWTFYSENLVNQPNPQPFAQTDWPNPQPTMWYRDWNNNLLETTLFQVFKPFNQSDWPNPLPVTWYRDWYQNLAQQLKPPFFQSVDFPLPVVSQPIDQTWIQNIINVLSSLKPPISQSDWPLPKTFQPIDQTWTQNLLISTLFVPVPFNQLDWPNPQVPLQPILIWTQGLPPGALSFQGVPFVQSDWPLPKSYPPIDQFFMVNTNLLPIPPPPPEIQVFAGRQLTEKDVLRSWMKAIRSKGR